MDKFDNFDFSKLNLVNFDEKICVDGEIVPGFTFCTHFGLISAPPSHKCFDCHGLMLMEKRNSLKLKYRYRCNLCMKVINMPQYTWFSDKKLSVLMSLKVIFMWTTKCSVNLASSTLGVSENTICKHFMELRELCVNKCSFNEKKLEVKVMRLNLKLMSTIVNIIEVGCCSVKKRSSGSLVESIA